MTIATLFIALFICMMIGMPIAIALGFSSMLTILLYSNDSLASIVLKLYESTSEHYTLLAIPFFILSSAFLSTGGVARRIIDFAMDSVGHIRGGLAMASVMACMLFAAVSGSSPATVAAIGSIVIVGMVRAGYPEKFAAGVITTSGTLGILIPPSIVMLVYAAATEVSAARMFMAGLIPGLMMGCILMLAIYIVARIKKLPSRPFPGIKALSISSAKAMGGLALILIVLGSIYGGVASPTEAAAVACVYAYFIAVFGYRDIGPLKNVAWRNKQESLIGASLRNIGHMLLAVIKTPTDKEIRHVVRDGAKVSIMLLFIIANAMLFAHVLTTERIPHIIAETIVGFGLPAWGFLIIVNLLLLAAGNFMEPSAILLIMAPILFPIATQLGIDPIHLGIIMVVNMEIGMLTPPVGLNLFVTAGITGKSMGWVIQSCLPWLVLLLGFLMLITYIPQISLFLPEYIDKLNGY
ncbi:MULTISPECIES: TRAP transporter large permease [Shewanella]|jgi:C4-dicarboxylate transporter DctM subunit|uniref:TRAP dicarboxylate transporter, DctM subunit n=2 Tax=Shewanella frigidimarina TaxID=56812 RepID=Q07ZK7_SHEFN|nr:MULTISPECIES: TRAP transporter large permease subunit [Shewanella]ABI72557.1 TRAP dicarboxylate transporter, DctM subunit [Shewanella frigidimarina NCIMB 400]KVX03658.1 C4-dicarboxylate ABC transporter permease [Shewanella frigidimarina]MBB1428136.1 TRAP transporter large permease subunit [Shewanella sp. SG44-2]PKI08058.1 C4-dicarboxylate ABC transporter permease [Shewanella sp. 11B5]RPA38208.1 TRAP transporter large permease subunit [Shewanella frigidimarina]|tara:strand:+ start:2189 stop:3586 length:1398 start_codon:yes stop_codon:yes gene_type:complete